MKRNQNLIDPRPKRWQKECCNLPSFRKRSVQTPYEEGSDALSTAIGSKEHGGHVRGLSSKPSIKDGFEKDRARYRSHEHYKEEIVAASENAMHTKFKDLFMATLAEQ